MHAQCTFIEREGPLLYGWLGAMGEARDPGPRTQIVSLDGEE